MNFGCKLFQSYLTIFFSLFQGYSPILQTLSLPQCQINCQNVSECQFWSYEISTQKCYLKTKRNNPTKRVDFISGIKDCSSTNSEIKSEAGNSGGQIYVMLNGGQKLSVLPANFGKQFHSGIEVNINKTMVVPKHFRVYKIG